jgi:hypothetical protein
MNFLKALEAANADAEGFVLGGGKAKCPLKSTGLIVVAYREDTNEVIPGAGVTVGDNWMRADEEGQARFLPIPAGLKRIKVSPPLGRGMEGVGEREESTRVIQGSCAVCPVGVPVRAVPAIKIVWLDDATGVANVQVELVAGRTRHPFPAPTKADGGAAWVGEAIDARTYDCAFTFPGDVKYLVHDSGGRPLEKPSIALAPGSGPFTFKLRRSWVKLAVTCEQVGELDAQIKVKDRAEAVKLEKGKGVVEVKEIAIVKQDQACELESFAPDGDGVYELCEVATT